MPFVSNAQRKFFNANKASLEKQGVDVNEWNQASKGMNLPDYAPTPATSAKPKKTKLRIKKPQN